MAVLVEGGRDAVSTRVVCQGAGIQAPTLYREFGDKQGLLDAVAQRGFAEYLDASKPNTGDPIEDLRHGWDVHLAFGLSHPYLYSLTYGDARPGAPTPAAAVAHHALSTLVHNSARAGLLAVTETRAIDMLSAALCGVTLTLITGAEEPAESGLGESGLAESGLADDIREHVLTRITFSGASTLSAGTTVEDETGPAGAAIHLHAVLDRVTVLSPNEAALLADWLHRIAQEDR